MPFSNIDKPNKYFNTILYTGNGSARSLTGVNFKPDFVWIKSRSSSSWWHQLQDIVRGATKRLVSNETVAEATDAQTLTSFDTDGFSLGTSTSYNNNSDTYVAWNWLASNTTVSNTAGSISSTVSANTTSGFSVGKTTGTLSSGDITVGHGLGVAPSMIFWKRTDGVSNWQVYHKSTGTGLLQLNQTSAVNTGSAFWGTMSSTTFTVSNSLYGSGETYVFYAFAEVKGYSKFGSFVGNGSTDGTYVHLGFRPAFVMIKGTQNLASATPDWRIRNNKTNTYNPITTTLYANSSGAEVTEDNHDFLSNGFKVRTSGAENNYSGETYIYMAFAENPFVSSKGIPTTAR